MNTILANYSVSVSDLRKNPTQLIEEASGETVAVLNRNKPTAYLVAPELYEKLIDLLDDIELNKMAKARLASGATPIEVDIDDL